MSIPARPKVQHQGPACSCVIGGKCLGWLSCGAYSTAMAIDKATLGAKRPTGCQVRAFTGDTTGGLSGQQYAKVSTVNYGVATEVHSGSNVATPAYLAAQLRAGRGSVVQGSTKPLLGTQFQSTGGTVNHGIYANEGRGWNTDGTPDEVLVYDPAADGRRAAWGTADVSPAWWPWSLLLRFAAYLRPWGDSDPRIIGTGRIYCVLFPDTEPHVHLRYGGKRSVPFPDRTTAWNANPRLKMNVRSRPDRLVASDVVDTLTYGEAFVAYQVTTTGILLAGSRKWFGDHNGTRWVHSSGLHNIGGAS